MFALILIETSIALLGAAAAWFAWHNETTRYLVRFILIGTALPLLGVPIIFFVWALGVPIMAYQGYTFLTSFGEETLGLHPMFARALACLLIVPALYGFLCALRPKKQWWQSRWAGIGFIALIFAALFALGYRSDMASGGAFNRSGGSKEGLVYLQAPDGTPRVKRCNNPGKIDQATGLPCQALKPGTLQYLDPQVAKGAQSIIIEDPKVWYGQDGKPAVFVCRDFEKHYYFVGIPNYIEPTTGKQCDPINAGWIQRWDDEKRKKARQEAEEARKRAEAKRKAEEERTVAAEHLEQDQARLTELGQQTEEQRRQSEAIQRRSEARKRAEAKRKAGEERTAAASKSREDECEPRVFTSSKPVYAGGEGAHSDIRGDDQIVIRSVRITYNTEVNPAVVLLKIMWHGEKKLHDVTVKLCEASDCDGKRGHTLKEFNGWNFTGRRWTLFVEGGEWLKSWSITVTPALSADGSRVCPTDEPEQPVEARVSSSASP